MYLYCTSQPLNLGTLNHDWCFFSNQTTFSITTARAIDRMNDPTPLVDIISSEKFLTWVKSAAWKWWWNFWSACNEHFKNLAASLTSCIFDCTQQPLFHSFSLDYFFFLYKPELLYTTILFLATQFLFLSPDFL